MRVPLTASLACALVALTPLPALADEVDDSGLADVAGDLSDPARQEQIGAMAGAMMEAMLQMPVGPMLRAAAEMAGRDAEDIDPDTRLADVAGEDAADAPREVAERVPQMMGVMAGMAGAMEQMLPQLREMAETMRRSLPESR
jgi:methyl-accepting chemotaxis protein